MTDTFLTSLFQHKAWANRGLVAALKAAPAEADRAQMAIAVFTLAHTSYVDQIFKAHLAGEGHAFEGVVPRRMPDLDELAETIAATDAWYVEYAGRISEAALGETITFTFVADGDAGRMTRGEVLAHVITHGASHRGAVGKMLELMKVPGASDMVTTFVREGAEGSAPP